MEVKKFLQFECGETLSPIYMLFGADYYFLRSARSKIVSRCNLQSDIDYESFEDNADGFLRALDSFPFASEKKVVRLSVREIDEKTFKAINKYLLSPSAFTVGIIEVADNKRDYKGDLVAVDCGFESQGVVSSWIVKKFRSYGRNITSGEANKIAALYKCDMEAVSNVVEILDNYLEKGTDVELSRVEVLLPADVEADVFELVNAVTERDSKKALSLIEHLNKKKAADTFVISMLYKSFERIFYSAVTSGSDGELAAAFKVKEGAIGFSRRLAAKYTPKRLLEILRILESAESKFKRGERTASDLLYRTVLQLL